MSKDNKHTQGSPGDFEDKIDSAMAGLEADLDEEFHGADFYDEDDQESDFDSWEGEDDSDAEELAEQDSEEEYPEEEEYDQDEAELSTEEEDFWDEEETESEEENSEEEDSESEDSEDAESADEPETSEKELQVEIIPPHSNKGRSTEEKILPVRQHLTSLRSRLLRNLPDRLRSRQPDLPVRRRFPMFLLLMRNWTRRSSLFPGRSIRDLKLRELWQLFLR